MKQKKLLLSLALALMSMAGHAADNLPDLHVEGKNLVDSEGKTVVLHGVMDTPNRYFNGNRWGTGGYSVSDVTPCLNYFEKMFTAITDKSQGAYCTVSVFTWILVGLTIMRQQEPKKTTSSILMRIAISLS